LPNGREAPPEDLAELWAGLSADDREAFKRLLRSLRGT